jgi:hypothetical protein
MTLPQTVTRRSIAKKMFQSCPRLNNYFAPHGFAPRVIPHRGESSLINARQRGIFQFVEHQNRICIWVFGRTLLIEKRQPDTTLAGAPPIASAPRFNFKSNVSPSPFAKDRG